MRTKLIKIASYDKCLEKADFSVIASKETIQNKALKSLTMGYTTYLPANDEDAIELSNKVIIKTESDLPRFNKEKVTINVGSNLYDKVLEAQLVGMHKNDVKVIETRGVTVKVTILEASKLSYPIPNEEMVEKKHLQNVKTVQQYYDYIENKELNEGYGKVCDELVYQMINESEFSQISDEDLADLCKITYQSVRNHYMEIAHGLDISTLPPNDLKGIFGTADIEQFYQAMKDNHLEDSLKICLIYCDLLQIECVNEYDPTINEDAEILLRDLMIKKLRNDYK